MELLDLDVVTRSLGVACSLWHDGVCRGVGYTTGNRPLRLKTMRQVTGIDFRSFVQNLDIAVHGCTY